MSTPTELELANESLQDFLQGLEDRFGKATRADVIANLGTMLAAVNGAIEDLLNDDDDTGDAGDAERLLAAQGHVELAITGLGTP